MRYDINQPTLSIVKQQTTVIRKHQGRSDEHQPISSTADPIRTQRDVKSTMARRVNCKALHVIPSSEDFSSGSSFTHPVFKVKSVSPEGASFQEPDSTKERVVAAETDGRANVVLLDATVSKKTIVSTGYGAEAKLVLHLFLHSNKGRARLITAIATSSRPLFSLMVPPTSLTTRGCHSSRTNVTNHRVSASRKHSKGKAAGIQMVAVATDELEHAHKKG